MKISHIPPFGVRMPPDLKEKIEMASKKSGRSMNAEVVYRLQQSFELLDPDSIEPKITNRHPNEQSDNDSAPLRYETLSEEEMLEVMDLQRQLITRYDEVFQKIKDKTEEVTKKRLKKIPI